MTLDSDREEEEEEYFEGPWWRFPELQRAILAGIVLGVGVVLDRLGAPAAVSLGAYGLAMVLGAYHWGREALEALARRRVNIDVLMAVATIGAAALGLWEEAAFLAFLYGAAEATEEYAYGRTRTAIRALMDMAPQTATLLRDGEEVTVPARELRPGDLFLVRPGEAVPTDGVIRRGSATLDESAVTGESVPVD